MKKIKLNSENLFIGKLPKKHGNNPQFYLDFERLNQYHPEVAHTVYCLLRKRWYSYFNVSEKYCGHNMDLNGNTTDYVEKWLDYINKNNGFRNIWAYRLTKEALVNYVPGQLMNSWVGTDVELLTNYNEIFCKLCPKEVSIWEAQKAYESIRPEPVELDLCPRCGTKNLKHFSTLHVSGSECQSCGFEESEPI